jgi:hypothetical protein
MSLWVILKGSKNTIICAALAVIKQGFPSGSGFPRFSSVVFQLPLYQGIVTVVKLLGVLEVGCSRLYLPQGPSS